jgi:hypothetical protein
MKGGRKKRIFAIMRFKNFFEEAEIFLKV